ncbi:MAG: sugar ABC transporter permease [Bacteroidota bacterium]
MNGLQHIVHVIKRGGRSGSWLTLPYIIFFLAFVAYPLIFSFILIFHRWNIVTPMEWSGLRNFSRLFADPLFFKALGNTGIFLVIHIPLQIVVALGLAVLLYSRIRLRGFFRAVYFLPVVVSGVVVTILWQQMYSYDYGVLNILLTNIGLPRVPWIVDPNIAMPSIAIMATWKNVGLYIVLFLVGLQQIPRDLYEVADLDGATKRTQFFRITLPLLNPTIAVIVILSTIAGFSLFIEPYVLTGGGPMNSTLSTVLYIYNQAFYFNHMGYAATLGLFFAFIIITVVIFQRKLIEKESYA